MAISGISPSTTLVSALKNGTPLDPAQPESPLAEFSLLNPHDGATIEITPDRVAARAQNGDVVTFYRKTLDYSFETPTTTLASLANGTIAVSEHGAVVEISPDKHVTLLKPEAAPLALGSLDGNNAELEKRVLASHLIDAQAYTMLLTLHNHGNDLSTLPRVRSDYDSSTDDFLSKVQSCDFTRHFGQPFSAKITQSQNGSHGQLPENGH